jgi:DNA-binding NtrC family response regulator
MDIEETNMKRLLIVDDEKDLLNLLKKVLSRKCNCKILLAENGKDAQQIVDKWKPDVVLTDIIMPDSDGLQLLSYIMQVDPTISTVIMTGYGTVEMAVKALKLGAYDFFEKPFDNDKIARVVKRALERTCLVRENKQLQQQLTKHANPSEFIGKSKAISHAVHLLTRFGQSDATLLIRGESGTGKEVAARTVHAASKRAHKKMITVNCPALPEQILESELFGYCKGAFTGADHDKDGLFLEADGSTILLDEIADIPVSVQTKLLRVLQEKEIQPLGQTNTIQIDVRVLASTNQDLEAKIKNGEFREDLYYRLNVMTVSLPSLADMREDIPLLAQHFINLYQKEYKREGMSFSPEALQFLMHHTWQGNIREFQNIINRAVLLAPDLVITPSDLDDKAKGSDQQSIIKIDVPAHNPKLPYKTAKNEVVSRFSVDYLSRAMKQTSGNVSLAAKHSGMERQAFQRLLKRHDLVAQNFRV